MIQIGTTGIDFDHFDYFFPQKVNRLSYYAEHSLLLELVDTFHRTLPSEFLMDMHSCTPQDFTFVGRMLKKITLKPFQFDEQLMKDHFSNLESLQHKMPILLFSFEKKFSLSEKSINQVTSMISAARKNYMGHILLDFVNNSWYKQNDTMMKLLEDYACSMVNSDQQLTPHSMRDDSIFYLRLTGDKSVVPRSEFGLNSLDRSRDLKYWATYIKSLVKRHKFIYVTIGNHFSGNSIKDAEILGKELNKLGVKFNGFNRKNQ